MNTGRTTRLSLLDSSVIIATGDDHTLTEPFRSDWRRRINQITDDPLTYLGLFVDADPASLVVDGSSDGVTVRKGSGSVARTIGEWRSRAAMVADIAAVVSLEGVATGVGGTGCSDS